MAKAKVDGRSKQGRQRKKWREEKSGRRARKKEKATQARAAEGKGISTEGMDMNQLKRERQRERNKPGGGDRGTLQKINAKIKQESINSRK